MGIYIKKLQPLDLPNITFDEIMNEENRTIDFSFIVDVDKLPLWLQEYVVSVKVNEFDFMNCDDFLKPDKKDGVLLNNEYAFNYLLAKEKQWQNGNVTKAGLYQAVQKINPDFLVTKLQDIQSLKKYWKRETDFDKLVSTFVEERHFLFFDF